jgi:excisionase family DNA binding protein
MYQLGYIQTMNTTYLSLSEVAQELSLTRRDIRRLIESGKLPGFQFGNQIRVDADDLAAFIEASRVRADQGYLLLEDRVSTGVSNGGTETE